MKHGWPWKFSEEGCELPKGYGIVHHDLNATGCWCLPGGLHWLVNKWLAFKVQFVMKPGRYDEAIFESYGEGYHKGFMDGVRAVNAAVTNAAWMADAKRHSPEIFERVYGKKGEQ